MSEDSQRSRGSVAYPVHGLGVDGTAAIVALMPVPIVLISTAQLEQVVAFQHGKIVAQHLIVPVPETGADLLVVRVERTEILSLRLATHDFDRAAQSGHLWRSWMPAPCHQLRSQL